MDKVDKSEWVAVQKKTFTRWFNSHLKKRALKIEGDLYAELVDGEKFINLLEIIGAESLPTVMKRRMNKNPKLKLQMLENLNMAIDYVKYKGIELVNIGSNDIYGKNEKIVLGLIFILILRFAVADLDGKKGLLLWSQRSTKDHKYVEGEKTLTNFTTSWTNGMAFCAIINRYRPDLIDYSKLNPADHAGNLELAFSVAQEKLGIDRLLDVADIAGNPAPDEKSIIAYVIEYWKVFSKGAVNDKFVKIIMEKLRIAKKQKEMAAKYIFDAEELLKWIAVKTALMEDLAFPNDTDSIRGVLESFNNYTRTEKPSKKATLVSLEALLGQLNANAKIHGLKPFVPPAGTELPTIHAKWDGLAGVEGTYRDTAVHKYDLFRSYDYNAKLFTTKYSRVHAWITEKLASFASDDYGSTVDESQTKLDLYKVVENDLSAYMDVAKDLEEIASKVGAEHSKYGDVTEGLAAIHSGLDKVGEAGTNYQAHVKAALEHHQKLVALQKDYFLKGEQTDFLIDALEETVKTPFLEGSESGLKALNDVLNGKFAADFVDATARVAALKEMAEILVAGGKTYEEKHDAIKFSARLDDIHSQLNGRFSSLSLKLGKVRKEEELKVAFAEAAHVVTALCSGTSKKVAELDGALEAQQLQLATIGSEWLTTAPEKLHAAEVAWSAMKDEGVLVCKNTSETIDSLSAAYQAVEASFSSTDAHLTALIMERDGKSAATASQIAEIKEAFNFFDVDKNGFLKDKEYKDACEGLGLVVSEEVQMKFFMAHTAALGLSLENFTTFVLENNGAGSGAEDVANAFATLSKSHVITEEQIKSTFTEDPELILMALREYHTPEGFDYKAFLAGSFN